MLKKRYLRMSLNIFVVHRYVLNLSLRFLMNWLIRSQLKVICPNVTVFIPSVKNIVTARFSCVTSAWWVCWTWIVVHMDVHMWSRTNRNRRQLKTQRYQRLGSCACIHIPYRTVTTWICSSSGRFNKKVDWTDGKAY